MSTPFFFPKCSCCDLLLRIRKMILPSFYDIIAIVNYSQVSCVGDLQRISINYFQTADESPRWCLCLSSKTASSLSNYRWSCGIISSKLLDWDDTVCMAWKAVTSAIGEPRWLLRSKLCQGSDNTWNNVHRVTVTTCLILTFFKSFAELRSSLSLCCSKKIVNHLILILGIITSTNNFCKKQKITVESPEAFVMVTSL